MPSLVSIALMIAAVMAVGALRETSRRRALGAAAAQRGWELHAPFTPPAHAPVALLAKQLDGRDHPATRWGAALTGTIDGVQIVVAEHEMPGRGTTTGVWHVMLAWSAHDTAPPPLASPGFWPHGGQLASSSGWAAWRLRGNLTSATLDTLLARFPEARRRF